jgi:hypothetical protein
LFKLGRAGLAAPLRFSPNLTPGDRLPVALGIYQESEERFESFVVGMASVIANVLPPIGERPSSWGPIEHTLSDTYFTEEDLPSDLIGFYRAIDSEDLPMDSENLLPEGVPPNEWESKMLLADICGFPEEEDRAVRWSRFVYSGQREAGMGWERIFEWGKARLVTDWDPGGCENTSWAGVLRNSIRYTCRHAWGYSCQWPSEFNRISSERSKLYDGKWWWVEDEELEYVGL